MIRSAGPTTVLVEDYDEAVDYYTKKLGFQLKEDKLIDKKIRVVTVEQAHSGMKITFLTADMCDKLGKLGVYAKESSLRILETQDVRQAYAILKAKGVKFTSEPTQVPYGIEASFEDLYGNEFDLIEVNY